jgi:hypothetical protein
MAITLDVKCIIRTSCSKVEIMNFFVDIVVVDSLRRHDARGARTPWGSYE